MQRPRRDLHPCPLFEQVGNVFSAEAQEALERLLVVSLPSLADKGAFVLWIDDIAATRMTAQMRCDQLTITIDQEFV